MDVVGGLYEPVSSSESYACRQVPSKLQSSRASSHGVTTSHDVSAQGRYHRTG
jgi:hypothetical protein